MSNELIEELRGYQNHCMNSGQEQVADLVGRAITALTTPMISQDLLLERTAQISAHRACCGAEHDPSNGKIHGYCVVCGVDWPCDYAGTLPEPMPAQNAAHAVLEAAKQDPAIFAEILRAAVCPDTDCDGRGNTIAGTIAVCCGNPDGNGDCCGNPAPEPDFVQCPWCGGSGHRDDGKFQEWAMIPRQASGEYLAAMASSQAIDEDGRFLPLMEIIGYKGEQQRTILRFCYDAIVAQAEGRTGKPDPAKKKAPSNPADYRDLLQAAIRAHDRVLAAHCLPDDMPWPVARKRLYSIYTELGEILHKTIEEHGRG